MKAVGECTRIKQASRQRQRRIGQVVYGCACAESYDAAGEREQIGRM